GYCRKRGLQDADAADVVQEVLGQVARSIRDFDYSPERGQFRNWLGKVTRGKLLRFFERLRPTSPGESPLDALENSASAGAEAEWTSEFNAQILRAALERTRGEFEPQTWRCFELVWLDDRPAAEAAEALGVPIGTIYVAKSRVLKRLREEVVHLAEDAVHLVPLG
ncbi:MAG TPA: sigma-70 family RNA polymerase sigma factor, partial [Pirellulales bacterium]|nr:sigma-70 family RNA polymerase sigma factor [Pirellulales bacterium]